MEASLQVSKELSGLSIPFLFRVLLRLYLRLSVLLRLDELLMSRFLVFFASNPQNRHYRDAEMNNDGEKRDGVWENRPAATKTSDNRFYLSSLLLSGSAVLLERARKQSAKCN